MARPAVEKIGTDFDGQKVSILQDFLINPLTSAQRASLAATLTPANVSLFVTDTDEMKVYFWTGTSWTAIGTGSSSIMWGSITGTISSQSDLQAEFATKQPLITTGSTLQYFRGDLSLATFPTTLSAFTNDVGFITGITGGMVIAALGYTPASNAITIDAAGNGITGGGSLASNRTIQLDFSYLDSRYAPSGSGVTSFNLRTGVVTLLSSDVTSALGFTPYNATNPSNYISLTALSASLPLHYNNGTGVFTIQVANTSQDGYLASTDWNTFNSKQSVLTFGNLTETTSSILTITGGTGAIIGSGVTIQVAQASGSQAGYLSSADWTIFNNKQPAGSYITALTGDVTAAGPGSVAATLATVNSNTGTFGDATHVGSLTVNGKGLITAASNVAISFPVTSVFTRTGAVTAQSGDYNTLQVTENTNLYFTNARAIASTLTGYVAGAGTVSSSDSILIAIQKLDGNIQGLTTGVSSVFNRTGAVVATNGDYNTSQVTENTNLYFTNARAIAATLTGYTSGAGTISSSDSILQAIQKLNGNIGALVTGVSSVNGGTGAVIITTTGTTNRITVIGGTGLTPTIDISSSYVGQSSITTLGTITTGIWNSTKIGLLYGGTNADLSGTGGTSQVLKQVSSGAAITVGQLAASDLSNGTTGSGGGVVLATGPTMSNPIVGTQSASDNSTKAASTAYVTSAIATAVSGINPAVAVQAATATILPNSPTYNNGVSGIGATLTAGVTNTTLVVDGYTPILNDRILIKNQASAFQNGVYFVSQLAALGLAWILTRALDYDQPSDINNTGAIPVVNGTVNATTSWVLTSTVNTIGTDSLTYTQFSLAPSTIQTTTLTNGHIWIGNGSNIATDNVVTGNVTISNTGVTTIGAGVVTNAMLAGSIASSKLIGTDIVTIGTITSGGLGTGAVIGGVTMTLGSDASFDTYYRNSSGVLTRLGNGTTGQFLGANTGAAPTWQTPSGLVTSVSNSDSTLTISPTTGAVIASLNLAHANTWTAEQTVNITGIATTPTDGFLLENTTAATSGVPIQYSPSFHITSNSWNTSALASQALDWRMLSEPTSANPISGSLLIQASINGGAYATKMTINATTGNISPGGAWIGNFSGQITSGAFLAGAGLDIGSDATGDLLYNNANVLSRLAIGTTGQVLTVASGLPSWSSTIAPIVITAGSTSTAPLKLTSGSVLTSVAAGAVEFDGNAYYGTVETTAGRGVVPTEQHFRLTSNGSTISTIANFFGTTSNPTLVSGAEYLIEIDMYYTNTTAGTVTWTFTNSAAPTSQNIHYKMSPLTGIAAPAGSAASYLEGDIQGNSTAAEALTTTGTLTTGVTHYAHFTIRLRNGTGTSLKIQATKLVGGTITPLAGSWWRCTRLPAGNVGIFAA